MSERDNMGNGGRGWRIRAATPGDAGEIARLAQALAEYEGVTSRFSEEAARRAGFGEGRFAMLVAEAGKKIAGFVLFYPGYDVASASAGAHLSDIFVEQEWRGQGIGSALYAEAAAATLARGGKWMSWTVLSANEEARRFYAHLGAAEVNVRFMAMGEQRLTLVAEQWEKAQGK